MEYLEYLYFFYFLFSVCYIFFFSVVGVLAEPGKSPLSSQENKIAVLVPAYKEDEVIVHVSNKALEQSYPSDRYEVIIIADSLRPATLEQLRQLPIRLIEVSFENSTKVKALNRAMAEIGDDYDIALVLDADNIMETRFLQKVNDVFNDGHMVIQTRRAAKNKNTAYAVLDALSEIINNHIYRKGPSAVGLSGTLTGSGMAFDYMLFKNTMKTLKAVVGFDRELEYELLAQGVKSVYFDHIEVYDHKTDQPKAFANQRKRWISSQFHYLKEYFGKGLRALLRGDFVYFNSTILSNAILPRIILLGLLFVTAILSIIFSTYLQLSPLVWWLLLGTNLSALVLAVPLSFYDKKFFKAAIYIPQIFCTMFLHLFRLKGAHKKFIHTPHEQINT